MRLFKTVAATMAALLVSSPVVAAVNPAARLSLAEDEDGGSSPHGKGMSTGAYLAIAGGVGAVVAAAVLLSDDNKPASA